MQQFSTLLRTDDISGVEKLSKKYILSASVGHRSRTYKSEKALKPHCFFICLMCTDQFTKVVDPFTQDGGQTQVESPLCLLPTCSISTGTINLWEIPYHLTRGLPDEEFSDVDRAKTNAKLIKMIKLRRLI